MQPQQQPSVDGAGNVIFGGVPIPPPCHHNAEQFAMFVRGVEAILLQWTALHLVNNNRNNIAMQTVHDEILQWFYEEGEVYPDQLELYFEDFFQQSHVAVEDNSQGEVAAAIHETYTSVCQNRLDVVQKYEHMLDNFRKINPVQHSVYAGEYTGTANGSGQMNRVDPNADEGDEELDDGDDNEATYGDEGDHNGQQNPQQFQQGQQPFQQQQQQFPQQQQQQAFQGASPSQPFPANTNAVNTAAMPAFETYLTTYQGSNSRYFDTPLTAEQQRILSDEPEQKKAPPKAKKNGGTKDKDGWCTVGKKR